MQGFGGGAFKPLKLLGHRLRTSTASDCRRDATNRLGRGASLRVHDQQLTGYIGRSSSAYNVVKTTEPPPPTRACVGVWCVRLRPRLHDAETHRTTRRASKPFVQGRRSNNAADSAACGHSPQSGCANPRANRRKNSGAQTPDVMRLITEEIANYLILQDVVQKTVA